MTAPWSLLQVLLGAALLVDVWRIQDLYPALGALGVPTLIGVAALAVFVLSPLSSRVWACWWHPVVWFATAILMLIALSVPGSLYPGLSFGFLERDYLKNFALMILIAASIRAVVHVERLVMFQLAGAGMYALVVLTRLSIGPNGRLGELYYYDANDLALLLACSMPLLVIPARHRTILVRLVALGAFLLSVLTIMKTGSRGGLLGLLAAAAAVLIGMTTVPRRTRVASLVATGLLLMAVGTDRYWEMMATMLHPTQDYNWSGGSESGRMEVWKRGLGYMAEHPFLGVGARAFPIAEGQISDLAERQEQGIGLKWSEAHNSFVEIGSELGVGGLLSFMAVLVSAFVALRRAARIGRALGPAGFKAATIAQCLSASLVAYCVSGFFLSAAYSAYLYATLGMTVGLCATVFRLASQQAPRLMRPSQAGATRLGFRAV
ncbi:MAG TPA: O-antigen ligase family protein [Solirubrobacteraceae bacterium]|nr:O-antigen ligase family protein [Solirubrobacteraceae bacterium]